MSKKNTRNFEEQMQRLNVIVNQLEAMDLSLEQSVALYKEGRTLSASCKQLLENAKNEILLCKQDDIEKFVTSSEE